MRLRVACESERRGRGAGSGGGGGGRWSDSSGWSGCGDGGAVAAPAHHLKDGHQENKRCSHGVVRMKDHNRKKYCKNP